MTDHPTYFSEEDSAATVNARAAGSDGTRLGTVIARLVEHLHAFVKEVHLTQQEWETAVEFLTAAGQITTDERNELILLSDVLGLSMLVDAVNNRRPNGATENTVLGPFHVTGAPMRAMGDSICLDGLGEPCRFTGCVCDIDGRPVERACLDVWSDNALGFYDVQQPGIQPQWNNRGRFVTGPDGQYSFRGIKPTSYPIPDDGPVGSLLAGLGRHPNRPAHMHFIVTARGYQPVVTHSFVDGDDYLDSDAVFGVKDSLVTAYREVNEPTVRWAAQFNFVLVEADDRREAST